VLEWFADAGALLIEHHLSGSGQGYFHNGFSEIIFDPRGRLDHYRVQDESD